MGRIIADLNDVMWSDLPEGKKFEFPVEVFPMQIQSIITDYNKYLNYPVEFTSAAILAVTCVTIGNTTELKVITGWKTTAVMAFIIIADRGNSKSHPLNSIFQPLFEKEKVWINEYNLKLEQYLNDLEDHREAKRKKQETGEKPIKPISKRITMQTFTREALAVVHSQNPHGLIVYVDEVKQWFGTFNQYTKGADDSMWINFLNGGHLNNDTINRGNSFVPKGFVSVIGGIQPPEFASFIKENTASGLFDRILYFYPKYLEYDLWPTEEMPQHSIDQWWHIYQSLFDMFEFTGFENVETIKYEKDAWPVLVEWQRRLKAKHDESPSVAFKAHAKKAETNIHRLAMILQALHSVCNGKTRIGNITVEVAEKAIIAQNYFIQEVMKTSQISRKNSESNRDKWFKNLPDNFNTKQAVDIALENKLCQERTVFNWLEKDERILKESSNNYKKIVK